MADKRCENGHFIDEAWDICPYCPPANRTADVSVVVPRREDDEYRDRPRDPEPPRRSTTDPARIRRAEPDVLAGPQRTVAALKIDASSLLPPRYVVGWLLALSGTARGEAYPIRMGKNVIGRDRKSDVVINDEQASAHHADLVFRPEERRFILMDHNSTNGTYVNGDEIEPRTDLADRDVIRIGLQKFLFLSLFGTGFDWNDQDGK